MNNGAMSETQRRLPAGRKADFAAYIADAGQVTVSELSERFGVSIDTVRRDLDQLHAEGVVIRTHGGAVAASDGSRPDQGLGVRLRLHAAEKEQIGALAAGLVTNGSVVIINSGTTALALARHLRHHRDLTVATNNLQLPAEISPKAIRDMYVFGGSVRNITQATTGPVSFQVTRGGGEVDVVCDLALVGVGAVSDHGYSTSNLADAAMMTEMMHRAQRVAVLADSSKFGRCLFAKIADLGAADYLVTDRMPEPALAEALEAAGVEVVCPPSRGSKPARSGDVGGAARGSSGTSSGAASGGSTGSDRAAD